MAGLVVYGPVLDALMTKRKPEVPKPDNKKNFNRKVKA
jgi:hypothetical protein